MSVILSFFFLFFFLFFLTWGGMVGLRISWLSAHNVIRRRYKAPDLTWSPTLARAAKVESDTCVWQHTVNNVYGEVRLCILF